MRLAGFALLSVLALTNLAPNLVRADDSAIPFSGYRAGDGDTELPLPEDGAAVGYRCTGWALDERNGPPLFESRRKACEFCVRIYCSVIFPRPNPTVIALGGSVDPLYLEKQSLCVETAMGACDLIQQ